MYLKTNTNPSKTTLSKVNNKGIPLFIDLFITYCIMKQKISTLFQKMYIKIHLGLYFKYQILSQFV